MRYLTAGGNTRSSSDNSIEEFQQALPLTAPKGLSMDLKRHRSGFWSVRGA